MNEISAYNRSHQETENAICEMLMREINAYLPEAKSKLWHGGPVWFLDGNPVAGYSVLKGGVQLLFWSGASFDEAGLTPLGKHKAAAAVYVSPDQVDRHKLKAWLLKAREIQWDYKHIVRNNGELFRLR
ncbi:MAG: DUF1801 domain-containing protein [Firmicutes bacterium]|nr:DUF1801 domain-containing protein [Bacillota bacterium]